MSNPELVPPNPPEVVPPERQIDPPDGDPRPAAPEPPTDVPPPALSSIMLEVDNTDADFEDWEVAPENQPLEERDA